jgi:hypothetical protein
LFGDLSEERITEIARYQFPSGQMEACTIAKDFRNSTNPRESFEYDEAVLPPLMLE